MPDYALRVELNGPPDWTTYNSLHNTLGKYGFFKTIWGDDGRLFHLPDAMYVGTAQSYDIVAVRDTLKEIVQSVWASSEVIVFRTDAFAWTGLRPVTFA